MREVVNGKVYDTQTSICVAEYSNRRYKSDVYYCAEDLYLKKDGEFFLYGVGGGMSKYAKHSGGNSWREGSEIIPLTEEEAREWLIEHFNVDDYMEFLKEFYSIEVSS